jgi:hypothetical protein
VDSAGHAYVTGSTNSTNFPTKNALQPAYGGNGDAFVAKLDPTGSALIYSTYLGGSGGDAGYGIAVDSAGSTYVTGITYSTDFPTKNPLQPAYGGNGDAFVSKINPTGSALVYSTYLGGGGNEDRDFYVNANAGGIAVDSAGDAYVTGKTGSVDFPTTLGAFETVCNHNRPDICANLDSGDAFVTRLNSSGSALVYSTYLGGMFDDIGFGVAADNAGNAYVIGFTDSPNFPTKNPFSLGDSGNGDTFVTKIDVRALTTTTLSSSLNPSIYGQAVTFNVVVTSSLGAPPDGETVTFLKGTMVLGTGALTGGSTSFVTSTLLVGTDYIKAVYGGDLNFGGSASKWLKQVVSKATTTTTLGSSLNPSNAGQSVTFTAKVTPQFSGTVHGTVTFFDGTRAKKTVSLSGGVAKYTTSTLASGKHSIRATYNGSTSFTGSSASLTQTVN